MFSKPISAPTKSPIRRRRENIPSSSKEAEFDVIKQKETLINIELTQKLQDQLNELNNDIFRLKQQKLQIQNEISHNETEKYKYIDAKSQEYADEIEFLQNKYDQEYEKIKKDYELREASVISINNQLNELKTITNTLRQEAQHNMEDVSKGLEHSHAIFNDCIQKLSSKTQGESLNEIAELMNQTINSLEIHFTSFV